VVGMKTPAPLEFAAVRTNTPVLGVACNGLRLHGQALSPADPPGIYFHSPCSVNAAQ
jgi:hypothetical protein